MKVKKVIKGILIAIVCILLVVLLLIAVMFIQQAIIDYEINDDYISVINDISYQTPMSVEGVNFIEQKISCGYACIEILSNWQGKDITEQTLFEDNGDMISISMGTGFLDEISKQFPKQKVTRHVNLKNSELLLAVYESLADGIPVPIEFAALRDTSDGQVWTLHFAIVTGMDLENDSITVQNPYAYEEKYTVDDFLKATRYSSYENMELVFKFGFAFTIFHKNTIYIIENK